MKALIAVTTNKNGDKIAEHAGHGVYFKIYEIDEQEGLLGSKLIKVAKEHNLHNLIHAQGINPQDYEVLRCQIILTGSIGMGAINKLYQIGIRAYIVEETSPDEAINHLINGTLKAVDPSTIEHTHQHSHEHGEGGCQGHHEH